MERKKIGLYKFSNVIEIIVPLWKFPVLFCRITTGRLLGTSESTVLGN